MDQNVLMNENDSDHVPKSLSQSLTEHNDSSMYPFRLRGVLVTLYWQFTSSVLAVINVNYRMTHII